MGLVYCIHCNETGENYIGSTTTSLRDRMYRHNEKRTDCSSKQIIDRGNYDVSILEDNIENDILKVREQFYMDCCDNLVNQVRAYRTEEQKIEQKKITDTQFKKNNPKKVAEWNRKWNENNKEKRKEYRRARMSIIITCECGSKFQSQNYTNHFKSKKHQKYLTHKLNVITVPCQNALTFEK